MTSTRPSRLALKALATATSLLLSAPTFAQSINVDCGDNDTFPVPSAAYGAGASQAGTWNDVSSFSAFLGAVLSDTSGSATPVIMSEPGLVSDWQTDNVGTTGDDNNLLDDCYDVGAVGNATTISFDGLAAGDYQIYTYAWAPDDRITFRSDIDVAGSASGVQTVGGAWTGAHVLGVTYAQHAVTVSGGSTVAVTITTNTGFGSVNGFQIVPDAGGPTAYCSPGNSNSVSAGGGVLASAGGYGTASATFDITDVPDQPGILYSGDGMPDLPFGCGRRCVGGSTIRGGVVNPSGNQALGVGFDMSAPTSINMQYWYRDPANLGVCGSAFNLSNALMP